jgi:tRNA nucleotidyltransferase (CCA-adding enzyme)
VKRAGAKRADAAAARRALPPALAPRLDAILAAGDRLGLGVLLVGGPVRDLLLGRPLLDLDLIVEPRGAPVRDPARVLAEAAGAGQALVAHARFGTVTLAGAGGGIDLAVARTERYAAPGALPEVAPASVEEDLGRRDFSVNAMAIPLNETARRGRPALVDPLGGRRDLGAGFLRILHARSFHDDPTRALRGARLAARLRFRLDAASRRALGGALGAGAFDAVSGERFRAELAKLFAEPAPAGALAALERWGVLAGLARGLALAPAARAALGRFPRLRAAWPAALAPDLLEAGLAAWLAPLAAPVRRRALVRLALTGRPAARIDEFAAAQRRVARALARAPGRGALDALLQPLAAETLFALAAGALAPGRRALLRHAAEDRGRKLPVDGTDLAALGLAGPALGRVLAALRRACLDGEVTSREEALAFARRRAEAERRTAGRRNG